MESYTVSAATSNELVTTSVMKDHCRVLTDEYDTYFESVVATARAYAETFTNRALINRSCVLTLDEFPTGDQIISFNRYLPVRAISSINYYDASGTTQSTTEYTLDILSQRSRLYPEYNEDWPTVYDYQNVITITFTCGPGSDTEQDWIEQCSHAIKVIGDDTWKHRGSVVVGQVVNEVKVPAAAKSLLWQARVYRP